MKKKLIGIVLSLTLVSSATYAAPDAVAPAPALPVASATTANPSLPPSASVVAPAPISGGETHPAAHSGTEPAAPAAPVAVVSPEEAFLAKQEKIIAQEEGTQDHKAKTAALFKKEDKDLINEILDPIMDILESDRHGTVKIRIAATHLQELITIHKTL